MADNISDEQLDKLRVAMNQLKNSINSIDMNIGSMPSTSSSEGNSEDGYDGVVSAGSFCRIEPDGMKAWLYLMPPKPGTTYRKSDLTDFLEHNGIFRGFHSSNLSAMVKKGVYEREILVAEGQPVEQGINGYFEYLFSPGELGKPRIREDGSVDYTAMSELQNVHKGDKVAIYHEATDGIDGYDVRGNEIAAKLTKDIPPLRGRGIEKDGNDYYAVMDGKIELKGGAVDIRNVHTINGDVNNIIGKIEFFGDVIICGNVEAGVTIRAGRNIEIKGGASAVNMYAGGDIVIAKGIQGGEKAKVSAKGNVMADFIEYATIEAKGDVNANSILNSNVIANGIVKVNGRRGVILGGYVHGLKGLEAENVGNDMEVKTLVHAGYEGAAFERLIAVKKELADTRDQIAELVDKMADALREKRLRGSAMSAVTEKQLIEWDAEKDALFARQDSLESEDAKLSELIEAAEGAELVINGNVFSGTVVGVNADTHRVTKNTSFTKYVMEGGSIAARVLSR